MPVPRPLTEKQRLRTGCIWIRDAAEKVGKGQTFGDRIGIVINRILIGDSPLFQKRDAMHKLALSNRSQLVLQDRKLR